MNQLDKLQSALNRSINTPLLSLMEFWDSMPVDYLELSLNRYSAESVAFDERVIVAQRQAVLLLNRLTAFRGEATGESNSPKIIINDNGGTSIDVESGVCDLWSELQDYILEERQAVLDRFGE